MKGEIKNWQDSSKKDFDTAKYLFDGRKYEESAFFCQQAVEKVLKALLLKKTKELLKIHDLVLLAKKVNAPKEIIISCSKITPAYIDSRYPDLFRKYSEKNSKKKKLLKKKGLERIKKKKKKKKKK